MPRPLDQRQFSNIPEKLTPEEYRRRLRDACEDMLRQLDDPEWFARQMRPRFIGPEAPGTDPETLSG